ncbi:MAG: bifunctional (p)ppGpp synthetase/guanosine-3',5'-bis(diphosphate) 3'-pyrophosphohydrolase, partial [Myxococcales bacterium]|nr:bifunctional (p)ppGpp synthetase/guanosine-3',5'-bis(diphosphate) 3'-pyrophosphohydrolase [Myxococcales bacterium]
IQIRTDVMHQVAEEGVAAHWLYKDKGYGRSTTEAEEFKWIRQLIEDFQEVSDPSDFMERLKLDLFNEEIFVFTPKGDIRAFPVGATVIDFAYSIHTEVGDHTSGARINGTIVPLSQEMDSGDVIEIVTRPSQRPNKDWLEHVKTGRARSKIKHFLRTEARQQAVQIGREHLESELRKHGLQYKALDKKGRLEEAADACKLQSVEEMLMKLGYGSLSVGQVMKILAPEVDATKKGLRQPVAAASARISQVTRAVGKLLGRKAGVRIDGIDDDLLVRYARCCNPLPGEPIMGFITRGRGLTIHSADCQKVEYLEPERRIDVHWDQRAIDDKEVNRTIRIQVISEDKAGLLADVTRAFSVNGINIKEAHCAAKDGKGINNFDLIVTDANQLDRAMANVRKVPGVIKVERVRAT